jgi:hypothetical protein
MQISLAEYVVRFTDGSINHEETLSRFAGDLARFEAQREMENETIGRSLHKLFDQHKGRKVPTPFVIAEVLKDLGASPETYKILTEKVGEYIKTSSEFVTTKGKGGGVGRICDL